jgi:tetratricopeptide (TPR) repeat protein
MPREPSIHAIARLLGAISLCACAAASAADPAASIASVEGKGEFREASETAWRAASIRQPLFPTNFVRTLDLSKMAIVFSDRTQLALGANSTLQIKEVGPRTVVNLNKGKSWTQSKTTPSGLIMETPSALAAIRGTDWEMIVDDAGTATLSVFSGEVELYNDQGNVRVGPSEQARAEKGRPPVKLSIQVSRERMQWVSAASIDPSRHRGETLAQAYARLAAAASRSAEDELLLGDIEIYRGEVAAARAAFARGAARFPDDARFQVALAQVAVLSDDEAGARAHIAKAMARRGDSVDAYNALGDIERRAGHAEAALRAYAQAMRLAARDPRGALGTGVVEGERENTRRALAYLEQALALAPRDPAILGELGVVEGAVGDVARARAHIAEALEAQPDNYVALTSLGVVELRAGRAEAALDALLRATLIEPRYARAHVWLAATYYELGREAAALEELRRAAGADPKDPLPHLLASMVLMDRLRPVEAWQEAREALVRQPFAKSLNAVADNQRGVANMGYPLGFMGLESWARSTAYDSYDPFWGASHFFLSDRHAGSFDRRSELMQGFVTDPLAFGASNRFQSLLPVPGHHGTLAFNASTSDDLRFTVPVVTLNGYEAGRVPFAYFIEASESRTQPRNSPVDLGGPIYTVALGAKPATDLGVFLYAQRANAREEIGHEGVTGEFARVGVTAKRADAGLRYTPDARSSLWVKAGATRTDADTQDFATLALPEVTVQRATFGQPTVRGSDGALRYTFEPRAGLQLTAGVEGAHRRSTQAIQRDAGFHFVGDAAVRETLEQVARDRSASAYGHAAWESGALRLEAGAAWSRYRVEHDTDVARLSGPQHLFERFERKGGDPMAGFAWRFADAAALRAACRRWLRPAGDDTFMPVAVAGMALEDQLVLAGGRLDQCRLGAEWKPGTRSFVLAAYEEDRVRNLVSPIEGPLNPGNDVTNLERLRNLVLSIPPKVDELEEKPVFGEGRVRRATLAIDHIVARPLALRASYSYADARNTGNGFDGNRIPYVARHVAAAGFTVMPGWHSYLTVLGIYRTRRFADEANTVALPGGWDGRFIAYIETPDKRWSLELRAANLLKKEASDVFFATVSYRF